MADDGGAKDWNLPSAQHLAVLYDLVGDDVGHRFLAASRGAWNAHLFCLTAFVMCPRLGTDAYPKMAAKLSL